MALGQSKSCEIKFLSISFDIEAGRLLKFLDWPIQTEHRFFSILDVMASSMLPFPPHISIVFFSPLVMASKEKRFFSLENIILIFSS